MLKEQVTGEPLINTDCTKELSLQESALTYWQIENSIAHAREANASAGSSDHACPGNAKTIYTDEQNTISESRVHHLRRHISMPVLIGVSFKRAGKVYFFDPGTLELAMGDMVVVETARGRELGRVCTKPQNVEESEVVSPLKTVMRKATEEDSDIFFRTG